jgi:hypothetical protein
MIISQASIFKGPGGLALIIPWLVVLGLHLVLGPVAMYAAWKQGPSLLKPSIYLYFLIFAGANIWLFIHGSGLDREVQTVWKRHGNPLRRGCMQRCWNWKWKKPGATRPARRRPPLRSSSCVAARTATIRAARQAVPAARLRPGPERTGPGHAAAGGCGGQRRQFRRNAAARGGSTVLR